MPVECKGNSAQMSGGHCINEAGLEQKTESESSILGLGTEMLTLNGGHEVIAGTGCRLQSWKDGQRLA